MAQANAQIGVAKAAYFPTVTLSASAGFQNTSISNWLTWPSRVWSVGSAISETIYDGGLRRATMEQYRAQYDTVANYRNTVLTAFQQVEDNLAALRVLSQEIQEHDTPIESARRSLKLATDRYRLGIDPYLNVITAQTTLFSNQQTAVNLRITQIVDSVQIDRGFGRRLGCLSRCQPRSRLFRGRRSSHRLRCPNLRRARRLHRRILGLIRTSDKKGRCSRQRPSCLLTRRGRDAPSASSGQALGTAGRMPALRFLRRN